MHCFRSLSCLFSVLVFMGTALATEGGTGELTGRVVGKQGAPQAAVEVLLFDADNGPPPSPASYWRIPDYSVSSDAKGRFVAQVPHGTYYLGAVIRSNGQKVGPPVEGDLLLNVFDDAGAAKKFVVSDKPLDVGTLADVVSLTDETKKTAHVSAIEGNISTDEGKPVQGGLVFAFTSPEMKGRPLFASGKTTPDGRFRLRVLGGGTYYLKVRQNYGGGPPPVGSLIGVYGGQDPLPVPVKHDEIVKGIKVTVTKFAGQGPANRR